jgi:EmrB/QacA subfamily drug resistance transporter
MSSQTTVDQRTATTPPASRSGTPATRPVFWAIFPSIMLPMFLAVIDQTIVATALPAIASSLGEVQRVSWVVVSYLIAGTIAAPVYGRLGDAFGRRRLMFIALIIFMLASVLCALSFNIWMLSAMRIVQGFGGGGLMTLSQALVGEAVPPRERGRYQGYLAGVAVTSNGLGPVVGGYLTEMFGWPAIFLINIPIGLVALALVQRLDLRRGAHVRGKFDTLGLVLFAGFVSCVILAIEQVQHADAQSLATSSALLFCAAVLVLALWRHEQHVALPLLPVSLLRDPTVWRSDALAACHGAALVSLIAFLPIYLRAVRGAPPGEIGLLLMPLTIGIGIGSVITGRIVSRTGCTTILPFFGLMVATASLLFLAYWAPYLSIRELPWVFGLNALFMGTVMGVVQVTVQAVAGPKMLGAGAATVQFSRSVGAAFGTAIVSAVLFSILSATDRDLAKQFGTIVEQGPNAMIALEPARQAVATVEIGNAFRAAFLTIAGFTGLGVWLAWSIPLRRLEQ